MYNLQNQPWKLESLRSLIANTPYYYERGTTSAPNFNYDNESIVFKADLTGTYYGKDGDVTPFTWSFLDANKRKLKFVLQRSPVLTINWEIAVLNDFTIKYGEYYTQGTANAQSYAVRTPKASN